VQDTLGVRKVVPSNAGLLIEQVAVATEDIAPDALHLGALGHVETVKAIAAFLKQKGWRKVPLVLDTVLLSTSGTPLLDEEAMDVFFNDLMPYATVVTPNIPEFTRLSIQAGMAEKAPIDAQDWSRAMPEELEAALRRFSALLPASVLLKGGHLQADPIDRLCHEGLVTRLPGTRLEGRNTHGTGCALAASLACHLAQGRGMVEAAFLAKAYVAQAIAHGPGLGHGHGPLNLRMAGLG
jgi:hydroxymethylpyrimidine/phosphomethylpyrimidine kinase